jgi:hypothetical protein
MPNTDRNNRPKRQNTRHFGRFTVGAATCGAAAGGMVGTAIGDCGRGAKVVDEVGATIGEAIGVACRVGEAITGAKTGEARGKVGTMGDNGIMSGTSGIGATMGVGAKMGALGEERGVAGLVGVRAPNAMSKLNCDPKVPNPESTTST